MLRWRFYSSSKGQWPSHHTQGHSLLQFYSPLSSSHRTSIWAQQDWTLLTHVAPWASFALFWPCTQPPGLFLPALSSWPLALPPLFCSGTDFLNILLLQIVTVDSFTPCPSQNDYPTPNDNGVFTGVTLTLGFNPLPVWLGDSPAAPLPSTQAGAAGQLRCLTEALPWERDLGASCVFYSESESVPSSLVLADEEASGVWLAAQLDLEESSSSNAWEIDLLWL